ncbi:MAG: rRNA adenine N-6-methyltransferase family protein, partial [Jiangellaceae bacterium]
RKRTGDFGRWSRLTVASWPRFDWRLGHRIDRTLFHPVPRVDSAIMRLSRRSHPLFPADSMAAFRAFVALGFGGYGGSLRSSLRRQHPRRAVDAALRAAALPGDTVVGFVHPTQSLTIFRAIHGLET